MLVPGFDALSQICDKASYHEKIVIIKCSKIAGGIKNKHRNFPDNLPHQAVPTFDVSLNNKRAPKWNALNYYVDKFR